MTTKPRIDAEVEQLERAARFIRAGGVVAFPTETVYGLGANAFNDRAVARVFELKARPRFDPLIVHIASPNEVESLAGSFPSAARELAEQFWPGPLTLVLTKHPIVPDIVTSGLPSVAIRLPDHPVALALIRTAGVPIAAPSANPFGRTSPTTAAHVAEQFGEQLEMILDGGACRVGVESTIVSFLGPTPVLLRPGGIPLEDIEAAIGLVTVQTACGERPLAPGQLANHYAPRTPLRLLQHVYSPPVEGRVGLLSFRRPLHSAGLAAVEVLSETGDLQEAAANLFAAVRRLDAQRLDLILAEPVPETGLGRAMMDRLRRASAGRQSKGGKDEAHKQCVC
jgi:L-threonylcarbamoyladenylate synthase